MIIAIDLGSSSLRIVAYDCRLHVITQEFEATVKTAERLAQEGIVCKEGVERIINALNSAAKTFDFERAKVLAVTTEAMRQASNATSVIEQIYNKTGVKFNIISAEDEARFTAMGVSRRLETLKYTAQNYLLFDLGGASTEIIFVKNAKEIYSKSFKLGIVTASSMCETSQQLHHYLAPILEEIQAYITTLYKQEGKPSLFVATAGTPTTMAAYLNGMDYNSYDSTKINGYRLHVKSCDTVLEALLAMDEKRRAFYVGVGREALIIAGIEIVKMLYVIAGFSEAIVIDDGLREGVAISGCS